MDIDKFCFFQTLCKRALKQSHPKHPPSAGIREKQAAATQRSKTPSKYYLETPAITATTSSNVKVCLLRNNFFFQNQLTAAVTLTKLSVPAQGFVGLCTVAFY